MPDRKALLKKNARRQREIRDARDAKKQCRTCGDPAVISQRTGRLAKQCARHLDCDRGRKEVYVLAWEVGRELEFPLGPLL